MGATQSGHRWPDSQHCHLGPHTCSCTPSPSRRRARASTPSPAPGSPGRSGGPWAAAPASIEPLYSHADGFSSPLSSSPELLNHTYFGWAPTATSGNNYWEPFKFEIVQDGTNVVNQTLCHHLTPNNSNANNPGSYPYGYDYSTFVNCFQYWPSSNWWALGQQPATDRVPPARGRHDARPAGAHGQNVAAITTGQIPGTLCPPRPRGPVNHSRELERAVLGL